MADARATVADLRDRVALFARARGWERYHAPKDLALAVVVEAAELSEVFLWRGSTAPPRGRERRRVEDELADVAIYLMSLANRLSIDISDAVLAKLARNARRFPVPRSRGGVRRRRRARPRGASGRRGPRAGAG